MLANILTMFNIFSNGITQEDRQLIKQIRIENYEQAEQLCLSGADVNTQIEKDVLYAYENRGKYCDFFIIKTNSILECLNIYSKLISDRHISLRDNADDIQNVDNRIANVMNMIKIILNNGFDINTTIGYNIMSEHPMAKFWNYFNFMNLPLIVGLIRTFDDVNLFSHIMKYSKYKITNIELAMIAATDANHVEIMRILLNITGTNPEIHPLCVYHSVTDNSVTMLKLLMEHGVKIDRKIKKCFCILPYIGRINFMPIELGITNGNYDVVEFISKNTDICIIDYEKYYLLAVKTLNEQNPNNNYEYQKICDYLANIIIRIKTVDILNHLIINDISNIVYEYTHTI